MFQIEIIRAATASLKFRKFASNPITKQPHRFESAEAAQQFADSMKFHYYSRRTQNSVPTYYRIVEMGA